MTSIVMFLLAVLGIGVITGIIASIFLGHTKKFD